MDQLEFRLLGPFEVSSGRRMILSGGGKRPAILAVLLLSANEAVSVERLIDALWGETAPASAVNLVPGYVSDLRRILEPDRPPRASGQRLVSSHGYRLMVSENECDLMRFDALIAKAGAAREAGDLSAASWLLGQALGEWRGAPLLDFAAEQFASVASARLQEARLSAAEAAARSSLRSDGLIGRWVTCWTCRMPTHFANGWPSCGSLRCIDQDGRRMRSPCTRRFG